MTLSKCVKTATRSVATFGAKCNNCLVRKHVAQCKTFLTQNVPELWSKNLLCVIRNNNSISTYCRIIVFRIRILLTSPHPGRGYSRILAIRVCAAVQSMFFCGPSGQELSV